MIATGRSTARITFGAALVLLAALSSASPGPRELKTFNALTKPMQLRPGEVSNSFHDLKVPVGPIAVYSFGAEVVKVDENGDIVPALLSEVYLHHQVTGAHPEREGGGRAATPALQSPMKPPEISRAIGFGAGTESRRTPTNVTHPYAFVTEAGQDTWVANVHIINTGPLTQAQAHRCLECPCTSEDHFDYTAGTINGNRFGGDSCNGQLRSEGNSRCSLDSYYGGLYCCDEGELCLEASELPPQDAPQTFYLRYTVQYSEVVLPDTKPLYIAGCCDATGDLEHPGAVEYNIAKCDRATNPGCVHSLATRQRLGGNSSAYGKGSYDPERLVDIVFARGHQHRGGLGIHLFDDQTGETLCESLPEYGTEEEVIGNEKSYIIKMTTCRFDPPLKRRLKDVIRVVSLYDSTEAHTGVMGLMYIAIADSVDGKLEESLIQIPGAESDIVALDAKQMTDSLPMTQPKSMDVFNTMSSLCHPMIAGFLAAAALLGATAGIAGMYIYVKIKQANGQKRLYDTLPDQVTTLMVQ